MRRTPLFQSPGASAGKRPVLVCRRTYRGPGWTFSSLDPVEWVSGPDSFFWGTESSKAIGLITNDRERHAALHMVERRGQPHPSLTTQNPVGEASRQPSHLQKERTSPPNRSRRHARGWACGTGPPGGPPALLPLPGLPEGATCSHPRLGTALAPESWASSTSVRAALARGPAWKEGRPCSWELSHSGDLGVSSRVQTLPQALEASQRSLEVLCSRGRGHAARSPHVQLPRHRLQGL